MAGLRLPNIIHSRFLSALLKIIVHDDELSSTDLKNISILIESLDYMFYSKEKDIYALLISIKTIAKGKNDNINDKDLHVTQITSILPDVYTETLNDIVIPIIVNDTTVHTEETQFIMKTVSLYLKYGYLVKDKDKVVDLFTSLSSGSVHNVEEIISELKNTIADLHKKLYSSETSDIDSSAIVHMTDPDFVDKYFRHARDLATRPSRALKLGIHKLNEMLSEDGGLLLGRMYTINAPTNSFKTGLMMYMAKWIQMYNSKFYEEEFNRTGKRPTVLFVSLENTWDENTARFFSMYSGMDLSKTQTFEEAANMWKSKFYETDSIINICMVFGKTGKFGPMDLDRLIDDLESQGHKIIATFVDYMKVMKDDSHHINKREALIQISTDLHELVVRRNDMALVTAHHTNRDGDVAMSETEQKGGTDKIKGFGRQHLTEANSVEEPIDFSMYIAPEISPYDGKTYLTMKKGKCRYKRTGVEYFVHEMARGFYIRDDVLMDVSLSKDSIAATNPFIESTNQINMESVHKKTPSAEGKKGNVTAREITIQPQTPSKSKRMMVSQDLLNNDIPPLQNKEAS